MTKEDAEALVERARPYLNRGIEIKKVRYTFTKIGNLVCDGEETLVCKVNGILTIGGRQREVPLSQIVEYFEQD